MKTARLTPLAKGLLVVVILAVAGAALWFFVINPAQNKQEDSVQGDYADNAQTNTGRSGDKATNPGVADKTADNNGTSKTSGDYSRVEPQPALSLSSRPLVRISLDEWVGWKTLVDANGGLKTAANSVNDKLGLNIEYVIINDASQSSSALIGDTLQGAGYTVNRYAFLSDKFKASGIDTVMPVITNYSAGGDGIIAKEGINSVRDLIGKKVAVPRFSEAQTLLWYLLLAEGMSDSDILKIQMVEFDDPSAAAEAFFAERVDAACTWEPFLTQARVGTGYKVFFSTKDSANLILDGIVFKSDWARTNADYISAVIKGSFEALPNYSTNFDTMKQAMPGLCVDPASGDWLSLSDLQDMASGAKMTQYSDYVQLYDEGLCASVFASMSDIWIKIGEKTDAALASTAFYAAPYKTLDAEYAPKIAEEIKSPAVDFANDKTVAVVKDKVINMPSNSTADMSLLNKKVVVEFMPDTAIFRDAEQAGKDLVEFLDAARIIDGTVIKISGNLNPTPSVETPESPGGIDKDGARYKLSVARAQAVADFFIANGIDENRFVTVGNSDAYPLYASDSATAAEKQMNRRVDIEFYRIED